MLEAIKAAKISLDLLVGQAVIGLTDQAIPLDERWETYRNLVKGDMLVNDNSYGDGFVDDLGDKMSIRDDFYVERHETKSFISMYECISDGEVDNVDMEKVPAWREKVLASGYSSFTFDW